MANSSLLRAVVAGLLVAAWPLAARADKNNQNNKNNLGDDIHRQEKQITEAKSKLQSAKKQADAARADVKRDAAGLEKATKHAGDTRRKVDEEHNSAPPLVAAREQLAKAKGQFDEAAGPVRAKLQQQDDYRHAVEERDALKSRLANVPSNQADVRVQLANELKTSTANIGKLEATSLESNSAAKSAKDAVAQAEAKVKELVAKRDAAVHGDARILDAKKDLDKAKHELVAAEKKLATELHQLAAAEKHERSEENQLQDLKQKQQQQQQQQQNNNNKNKPKGKK